MEFFITCDINHESEVDLVIDKLLDTGIENVFQLIPPIRELKGIALFLICRDNRLNFKQRIRLVKKSKELHVDIMLNYNKIKYMNFENKFNYAVKQLVDQLVEVLKRYKFSGFDIDKFRQSLLTYFNDNFQLNLDEI